MDTSEAGRLGAEKTNKILTTAGRIKAAKKGWRLRKQRLENEVSDRGRARRLSNLQDK